MARPGGVCGGPVEVDRATTGVIRDAADHEVGGYYVPRSRLPGCGGIGYDLGRRRSGWRQGAEVDAVARTGAAVTFSRTRNLINNGNGRIRNVLTGPVAIEREGYPLIRICQ